MSEKIKTIFKLVKMSFTGSRLAYEIGYADGLAEGRRIGHEEGMKVWAAAAAENEKAGKAKV